MNVEILYRPAHTLARVHFEPGESVVAESGAMVGMSANVAIETAAGGFMKGLKRMFGGESFFRNTFTAQGGRGELLLAHALCGDMVALPMTPEGYFVQSSGFIASSGGVDVQTQSGGFKGFFSGAGLFVLRATSQGPGTLVIGAFGAMKEIQVDGSMVIDTGHVVAWDGSLEYSIEKAGSGWIASFLSGEGLVCRFRGRGRVWIQSRNPQEFGQTVGRLLPPRQD